MKNPHSRFFIKNFLVFLIPLLIPLLILGALTTVATRNFVKAEIEKNNLNLLMLTKNNLELIFDEMDSLYLNFSSTPEISIKLKKILNNQSSTLTFAEIDTLKTIKIFLGTPANAHPYIHSIYVYFNNPHRKLITTTEGLTDLNTYYDTSWYQSYLQHGNQLQLWTEPRTINRYLFEDRPVQVETIYRRLYTSGNQNAGVIVLNIKTAYIEHILDNLDTFPKQSFIIVDGNNRVIFRNRQTIPVRNNDLKALMNNTKNSFVYRSPQGAFNVSYLSTPKYLWKYVSIVPEQTLYAVPMKLQKTALLLLPLLFMLGLGLTFWLTRKNYLRIQNIISVIEAAKTNSPLPELPSEINDEYGFITYNLLTTFIEQNYLKLQLSERKYKLQAMELLALQSQINPHFLYNTLDTVKWQIIGLASKPNQTSGMIENLSDILKYSLEQPLKTVSLREEIQHTRNYIEILKVLYRNKFDLIWDYEESVLDRPVIRLLFQPLIENSIYHGIRSKNSPSILKIKVLQQPEFLKIAVIDNGSGIPPQKLEKINMHLRNTSNWNEHIGLANTKKRLELTFGERIRFKITSKSGRGTVITVKIPYAPNIDDFS